LGKFYPQTWFQLGDRDLATHIYRTDAMHRGESLSQVTRHIAESLGVTTRILPMSDDRVRTIIEVADRGSLPFQEYLVKGRGQGQVREIRFAGVRKARPASGVLRAIDQADAIILPPSNPLVSILPILSIRGVRHALERTTAVVAAVSPLIGSRPIKGPLHHMLAGLGHEVSAVGVARLYCGLVDLFAIDTSDAHLAPRIESLGMRPLVTDIIMHTAEDSRRLSQKILDELNPLRKTLTSPACIPN